MGLDPSTPEAQICPPKTFQIMYIKIKEHLPVMHVIAPMIDLWIKVYTVITNDRFMDQGIHCYNCCCGILQLLLDF